MQKALRATVALSLCRHSEPGGWVLEEYRYKEDASML
nr:MAG TPA: hypothetical protein [Caudoviricetes sp.]